MNTISLNIVEIKVLESLYPRNEMNTKIIEQYAENIETLPPIEINQNNILIDGAHRLSAYKQVGKTEIPCIITNTSTDDELYSLAIQRNSNHGYQLTRDDKKRIANRLCGGIYNTKQICKMLSISEQTYFKYTETKRKQLEEDQNKKILDLYLQCYTQEKIAEMVGVTQQTISNKEIDFTKNCKLTEICKDFKPDLYNIWSFAKNENETKHFGQIPYQIIENLLYAYTEPFDIIFDPFGGGGVTIDVCKKWYRRYYVSDIQPTEIAIKKGMRTYDITIGIPKDLPKFKLVFLDPPYWKQSKGQYTDKFTDFSNMELDEFYDKMEFLFKELKNKIESNGYLCFIIQNTQWLNNKKTEPHSHKLWNIAEKCGFKFENIIHVPYSTQQYNPQQVNYAKENKIFLELNRELIILKND